MSWSMWRRSLSVVCASILTTGAVITLTPRPSYGVPWWQLLIQGVQIYQLSNMSDAQEVELGQQIDNQLKSSGQIQIYNDPALTTYINDLGQALARKSDRPNIPYSFQVVDDNSINAFATAGGMVYIHTGLILEAENEGELASVIAHEIAHIASRHAIKQIREQAIAQGLLSAAGLDQSAAVQIGVDLAMSRPNSREDELEADRRGFYNFVALGYAPGAMVDFMEKLLAAGGSMPVFLSTHPSTARRIDTLKSYFDPADAYIGDGLDGPAYVIETQALR